MDCQGVKFIGRYPFVCRRGCLTFVVRCPVDSIGVRLRDVASGPFYLSSAFPLSLHSLFCAAVRRPERESVVLLF